jgi:hypothetical protein
VPGLLFAAGLATAEDTWNVQYSASLPVVTRAQLATLSGELEKGETGENRARFHLAGGAGVEVFDEDGEHPKAYLSFDLTPELTFWKFTVGLGAPLRVDLEEGTIREEDWDEASDFVNLVRYIRYGRKGDLVYARLGSVPAVSLGHGTIVDRLSTEIDLDRIRRGFELGINFEKGGFDYFQTSIGENPVLGLRGFVRPLEFTDVSSFLQRLNVGLSFVTDVDAPEHLERDPSGAPRIDRDDNFVYDSANVHIFGLDLEFPLLTGENLNLTWYTDLVFIGNAGNGFHFGFVGDAGLPFAEQSIHYQAEYRSLGPDYIPSYFDCFYDVQQFQYPDGGSVLTKYEFLQGLDPDGARTSGAFLEASWRLGQRLALGANWEDTFRHDGVASQKVGVFGRASFDRYRLGVAYAKRNFETLRETFTIDDRSMLTLTVAYQVSENLSVTVTMTSRFQLNEETQEYDSVRTYGVSVAYSF